MLFAGGGGCGDVEEPNDGPARRCRCTTVLDESEDDGDDDEGEATDDEEGTRDWNSRYLVLSLSNGLADRLMPLR